jgi:hypothetical protein
MPEPDTMKTGGSILFTSRGGFVEAVLTALASSRNRLVLVDHDFCDWPIDGPDACDTIGRMLAADRRATLRLMVVDPDWLERRAARFGELRRRFPSAIACRQVPPTLAQSDGLLIGDDRHMVRRAHRDRFRGRLTLDAPPEVEPYADRCTALWHESLPCLSGTRLGL